VFKGSAIRSLSEAKVILVPKVFGRVFSIRVHHTDILPQHTQRQRLTLRRLKGLRTRLPSQTVQISVGVRSVTESVY